MSIYVGEAFCTQLRVVNGLMVFDGCYTGHHNSMEQKFQLQSPKHEKFNFKLEIYPVSVLQRSDFRMNQAAWQTAVLYGKRLLQLRPNGDWFFHQMERLIGDIRQMASGPTGRLTLEQQTLGFAARPNPAAYAVLRAFEEGLSTQGWTQQSGARQFETGSQSQGENKTDHDENRIETTTAEVGNMEITQEIEEYLRRCSPTLHDTSDEGAVGGKSPTHDSDITQDEMVCSIADSVASAFRHSLEQNVREAVRKELEKGVFKPEK